MREILKNSDDASEVRETQQELNYIEQAMRLNGCDFLPIPG
jgi:hypothetical protein